MGKTYEIETVHAAIGGLSNSYILLNLFDNDEQEEGHQVMFNVYQNPPTVEDLTNYFPPDTLASTAAQSILCFLEPKSEIRFSFCTQSSEPREKLKELLFELPGKPEFNKWLTENWEEVKKEAQ